MRFYVCRFEACGLLETLGGFLDTALLFERVAQIDDCVDEVRRQHDRTSQQTLGFIDIALAESQDPEHAERVDVLRLGMQDFTIKPRGFFVVALSLLLGGVCEFLAHRIQCKRFFESLIRFFALADHRERLTEIQVSKFERRI